MRRKRPFFFLPSAVAGSGLAAGVLAAGSDRKVCRMTLALAGLEAAVVGALVTGFLVAAVALVTGAFVAVSAGTPCDVVTVAPVVLEAVTGVSRLDSTAGTDLAELISCTKVVWGTVAAVFVVEEVTTLC